MIRQSLSLALLAPLCHAQVMGAVKEVGSGCGGFTYDFKPRAFNAGTVHPVLG